MALNLCQSHTQVAFHHKFDALQLHLVNIDIETIISIRLTLGLDVLLSLTNQSEDALNEGKLERQ